MIAIFKTNIWSENDLHSIRMHLDNLLNGMLWNIDLSDSDKILRVDGFTDRNEEIISLFKNLGYECANLENFYSAPF